jgi:C-terminal processing protease CtpA/Prc
MKNSLIILSALIAIGFTSCKKDTSLSLNETIKQTMDEKYLWYDKMPSVDVASFKDPQKLVDALAYKTFDKWSFIITDNEYQQYYIDTKYYGHGFDYRFGTDGKLRICLVFKSSDMYKAGVRRGWVIKQINNTAPTSNNTQSLVGDNVAGIKNTFLFERPGKADTSMTFTKTEVKMDMIVDDEVLTIGDKTVGYLVLYGFIGDAEQELINVFQTFKSKGVNELVLDLRYNGGGKVLTGAKLGALIAGRNANNGIICKLKHNNKLSKTDIDAFMYATDTSLNLNRVFIITTSNTASTSEIVINGLKPFIDVKLIGKTTHGKPVGMELQDLKEFGYVFFPIMFKTVNKNDEGEYFNGIVVDKEIEDDITNDFGDQHEACLANAINYINTGSFFSTKKAVVGALEKPATSWWDQQFGVY